MSARLRFTQSRQQAAHSSHVNREQRGSKSRAAARGRGFSWPFPFFLGKYGPAAHQSCERLDGADALTNWLISQEAVSGGLLSTPHPPRPRRTLLTSPSL